MARLRALFDFLDDRLAWRQGRSELLDEPITGGARFSYVFGSGLLLLIALQVLTGLVLAFYYSPGTTTAWESVFFIEESVIMGSLVRALHHHGASAFIILLSLHMAQVIAYGAYKRPREITWILGLLLFQVILAFALTGYLLPWDERGYGATKVATGIAGITPVVGAQLERLALGGAEYGQLTLTRFYAIHVIVLPGILFALVAMHLYSMRRHGVAPPAGTAVDAPGEPFWPGQALRDLVFAVILLLCLYGIARHNPAPLTAPADPASDFPARPEWYFLPLFQLLKLSVFQGWREVLGTHVLPGVLFLIFAGLPWIDRGPSRRWRDRKGVLLFVLAVVASSVGLAFMALDSDATDQAYKNQVLMGEERAAAIKTLARDGIPRDGARALLLRSAHSGAAIYRERCAGCHEGEKRKAPDLQGYLSIDWVAELIADPTADKFYGRTKLASEGAMGSYKKLTIEQRRSLAAYVLQRGAAEQQTAGAKLWAKLDCGDCHETAEYLPGAGPNLHGFGSQPWLARLIANPKMILHFGEFSGMPAFAGELSKDELEAVTAYVHSLANP